MTNNWDHRGWLFNIYCCPWASCVWLMWN